MALLEPLAAILGPLGPSGAHQEPIWVPFCLIWGRFWTHFETVLEWGNHIVMVGFPIWLQVKGGEPHCDGWFPRLVIGQVEYPYCDGWLHRLVIGQVG